MQTTAEVTKGQKYPHSIDVSNKLLKPPVRALLPTHNACKEQGMQVDALL